MRQIFEKYERMLATEFMTVADHCLRTWIFVRDIDHNYAGVVRSRKDYFETIGLTPETHFIASTGIAGTHANPQDLVMMDALAIPDVDPASIRYLKAALTSVRQPTMASLSREVFHSPMKDCATR